MRTFHHPQTLVRDADIELDRSGEVEDLGLHEDEPLVRPRRALTFNECTFAARRLANGDPVGWVHLMSVMADPNQPHDQAGNTLLHIVALYPTRRAIEDLLTAGANPTVVNKKGVSPLDLLAAQSNKVEFPGAMEVLSNAVNVWTVNQERDVLHNTIDRLEHEPAPPFSDSSPRPRRRL